MAYERGEKEAQSYVNARESRTVKEPNNIDELFKTKLQNRKFEVKPEYLDQLNDQLDNLPRTGRKRRFFFVTGGILAVLIIFLSGLFLLSDSKVQVDDTEISQANTPKEDSLENDKKTADSEKESIEIQSTESESRVAVSGSGGDIEVIRDNKLDALVNKQGQVASPAGGPQINGYRIQLFFDSNKSNINGAKSWFISRFPKVDTYITYDQPNFLIKVGDFRTRLEAERIKAQIVEQFPTSFIVREKINLPRLAKDAIPDDKGTNKNVADTGTSDANPEDKDTNKDVADTGTSDANPKDKDTNKNVADAGTEDANPEDKDTNKDVADAGTEDANPEDKDTNKDVADTGTDDANPEDKDTDKNVADTGTDDANPEDKDTDKNVAHIGTDDANPEEKDTDEKEETDKKRDLDGGGSKKSLNWSIQASLGGNYISKKIGTGTVDYINKRTAEEQNIFTPQFNFGINCDINNLQLATGANYVQYGENIAYTTIVKDSTFISSYNMVIDTIGDTTYIPNYSTISDTNSSMLSANGNNRHSYITIPLSIGYKFYFLDDKFSITPKVGVGLRFLMAGKGSYITNGLTGILEEQDKTFSLSYHGSIEFAYNFDKLSIFVAPNYNASMSSFKTLHSYRAFGGMIGLIFKLKGKE
jgi:hypothetical protein